MESPGDRIRTLLLRADNVLNNAGDPQDRARRARAALEEAQVLTKHPGVPPQVTELVERRLTALEELEA